MVPTAELYNAVKAKYSEEFFEEFFRKIELKNTDEQKAFREDAIYVTAGYLKLVEDKTITLRVGLQNELLEQYKAALMLAQDLYKKINADVMTKTKFHDALTVEYLKLPDHMHQMFFPYKTHRTDENGNDRGGIYRVEVLYDFFDALVRVCDTAKGQYIGNDRSMTDGDILAFWVATIGRIWPKSAKAEFITGDYSPNDDEKNGSRAFQAVMYLIDGVDKEVGESQLVTAMKKAIHKGQVQNPANLLLGL